MGGHYTQKLIPRARNMRYSPTTAECKLWYDFLRHSPFRVRRQCPIEGYLADFYVHEYQLVIEVDGNHHLLEEAQVYDGQRTAILESLGLRIVRFTNNEVLYSFPSVCSHLQAILSLPEAAAPFQGSPLLGEAFSLAKPAEGIEWGAVA